MPRRPFTSYLKSAYFLLRQITIRTREWLFADRPRDYKQIPVIINNYNRVSHLRALIERLEQAGYRNLYIIDNASTYPALLEYYQTIPYPVFRLDQNVGYLSFWKTGIYKQFRNQYFVYTDSDVVPVAECPDDFLSYFYHLLQKYPRASKVGFSLKTDDLPDHFSHKDKVLEWEQRFWDKPLPKDPTCYRAAIDTTFALYRPNIKGGAYFHDFMIRTAGKYTARHLPWYADGSNLSEEDQYYIQSATTSTHWTAITKD